MVAVVLGVVVLAVVLATFVWFRVGKLHKNERTPVHLTKEEIEKYSRPVTPRNATVTPLLAPLEPAECSEVDDEEAIPVARRRTASDLKYPRSSLKDACKNSLLSIEGSISLDSLSPKEAARTPREQRLHDFTLDAPRRRRVSGISIDRFDDVASSPKSAGSPKSPLTGSEHRPQELRIACSDAELKDVNGDYVRVPSGSGRPCWGNSEDDSILICMGTTGCWEIQRIDDDEPTTGNTVLATASEETNWPHDVELWQTPEGVPVDSILVVSRSPSERLRAEDDSPLSSTKRRYANTLVSPGRGRGGGGGGRAGMMDTLSFERHPVVSPKVTALSATYASQRAAVTPLGTSLMPATPRSGALPLSPLTPRSPQTPRTGLIDGMGRGIASPRPRASSSTTFICGQV